ncbi:MAG: sigma-54 dependent transcriptional regulator [Rubripirellula sp.]|nr:sigma-54 dependent transcriptional regulator [Rubripirellula sp.]
MNAPQCTVLVVDDEPSICWGFETLLGQQGYQVLTASSAEEALRVAHRQPIDLVVLDVRLPGEDGLTALPKLRQATNEAPTIVMTAFGDLETAVQAIQGGASDYLTKPFRLEDAARVCRQAIQHRLPIGDEPADEDSAEASLLVGQSAAMQKVFRQIALIAGSDLSVLVTGETGTGKELVAAAIHRHSQRGQQAYMAVSPVAFSESLVESELFGHAKSAFTGAHEQRKGLFDLANHGTVLLDEIGDLPMSIQVKLLRVIEQGEFSAVGDVRPRKCDVRVIAATNRDLPSAVAAGSFREDLLYRLSAVSIHLPPLRERPEDIPQLVDYFLRRIGYPAAARKISTEVKSELESRPWLGNVRELRNAIEHASVIARGRALDVSDLPPSQHPLAPASEDTASLDALIEDWAKSQLLATAEIDDLYERMLAEFEPAVLRIALQHTNGNRAAAAKVLGIHRGTLRDKMKRHRMLDD